MTLHPTLCPSLDLLRIPYLRFAVLQARIANVEDGVSRGLLTLIRRVGELQRLLAAVFGGGAVLGVEYGWGRRPI